MSVRKAVLVGAAVLLSFGAPAAAQQVGSTVHIPALPQAQAAAQPAPQGDPEVPRNPLASRVQLVPVLRFLQSQGVKLTSLGTEGSVPAYLGESPNGHMQVFYVMPDGEHVVAGLLFDVAGANVTGVQLGDMQRRFETAQKQIGGKTSVTDGDLGKAPLPTQGIPAAPTASPALPPKVPAPVLPQQGSEAQPGPASAPVQGSSVAASAALPVSDKYVSGFDRGAVERALADAAWFKVGVDEAPIMYMVVDPQCPFCHAAWGRLRDAVFAKKLQLRIVMIAGLKGSLPLAISILSHGDPGKMWLAGQGSQDGVEIDAPPQETSREYISAQKYLSMNSAFVRQFGITQTPTFLYIGKDERLYSSVGLPEDSLGFLSAMR